ncbi:hypothetical protein [Listeria rocourtiae]|uniref:hypothetical protein n=1 Tax=Listeria rocourtiae TaxID=647910 RepID=UPI003D2F851A
MKKLTIIFLSFSILVACSKEPAKETSKSNNKLEASVHTSIEDVTYDQAIKEADLIAEVKIGKLKEIVEGRDNIVAKSKFEGTIEKIYAGKKKTNDPVYILQEGKNGMEIENYPLFESGETYILMLMDSGDGKTFWIKGQVNGTYFVDGDTTLKFGDSESALPEKENTKTLDQAIIEKQEETANNSQVLDTEAFKMQLEKDVKE